jgi:predicted Zn-dependent protease
MARGSVDALGRRIQRGLSMLRRWETKIAALLFVLAPAVGALAAVPRPGIPSGQVVSANGDETIQFVAESNWRSVEIEQDLLTGDHLRTGPNGALALRFIDQTLIRVHRNSELVVKQIGGGTQAQLDLTLGQIWARALKGGEGLEVNTPSATAAIKGTDWSMSVEPGGRTTLIVMDGIVNLRNEFGSVDVQAGEAAIAEIGRAPNKILLSRPPGREQMLYYLQARGMFGWLPIGDLTPAAERKRWSALSSRESQSLSGEERLELAELSLHYAGQPTAAEISRSIAANDLSSPALQARKALLDALGKALRNDWQGAIEAFDAADPNLSGRRLLTARIGKYLALILSGRAAEARAMETSISALPADAYQSLAKAWFAATSGEMIEATNILREAEKTYPDEPLLPILRAQLAIALGDEAQAREASAKGSAIDPENPNALFTEATILSDYDTDLKGARAKLEQTIAVAPGDADAWNNLSLVLDELEDYPGAERANQRAIALDPYASHLHSNYARFLLIHNQLEKSKSELDLAKQLDPGNYAALQVEGVWLIAQGRMDEAVQTLLGSVAANPSVSSSSVMLAIAYYQSGQIDAAMQSLNAGDRLDPNDPDIALVRTVIELNRSQAGDAIRAARDAYRRYLRQGKVSSPLAAAKGSGSYLFSAFSNLSLNQWGRAYGDFAFNPFDSSSQFYQASAPVTSPVENGLGQESTNFNSVLQGLTIDPLSVAGRSRYDDLVRRPFFDPTIGVGGILRHDDSDGWLANTTVNAFTNQGLPVSLFASLSHESNGEDANSVLNDDFIGNVFLGTEFDVSNRMFVFGQGESFDDDLPGDLPVAGDLFGNHDFDQKSYLAGGGYSHRFGADNVLMVAAGVNGRDQDVNVNVPTDFGDFEVDFETQQHGGFGSIAHYFGIGDVTLRYGIEGQIDDLSQTAKSTLGNIVIPGLGPNFDTDSDQTSARMFTDAIVAFDPTVSFEFGLNVSRFDQEDGKDLARMDPRIGAGWLFAEGQWLHVAYREDTNLPIAGSLAPVATLGLTPAATPTSDGGLLKTAIVKWDSEWSERFFTSLEYQHQEIDDYSVGLLDQSVFFQIPVVPEGDLDILTLSMNAWVLEDFGVFAEGSLIDSDNESDGGDLPLIPEWNAKFGITWVSPLDLRVSVTENLVGSRPGDLQGNELSSFATTGIQFSWRPVDRHILLSAGVENLLDENYHIAHDVPAPGRVFTINGEIRF